MRGKTIDILQNAMQAGYAVGAFNTSNMEIAQGIVRAAHKTGKPCIVQVTTNALKYASPGVLGDLIVSIIKNESNSTKIGFHLDHGKSLDDVVRAIDCEVDSVMIDASLTPFKENIEITKRVVEYAHGKGVSVQAELGSVPYLGREDQEMDWDSVMTDPNQAKELVEKTGVDALAVAIGNAHGFFRERSEPDYERLSAIKKLLPKTPLILHGASDWTDGRVAEVVKRGISCFNIDTDIRVAFITAICNQAGTKCDVTDPRKILGAAREAVMVKVSEKIKMFAGA
jgi:fructose-bisphosphate aldolase class II